ncbi:MAG TPA: DUF2059 domain-containing protein [Candidatus Binatia bacterium]
MLAVAPSVRTAEAPTEESVRKLMSLTHWSESHELALQNIDASVQASLRQIFHPQDDSQEKAFAAKAAEIAAKIKEELRSEKVEPMYIDAYRKNLTQREVDDMIAFYASESGKSVVAKMPVITQQAGEAMQQRANAVFAEQMRKELWPFLRPLPGKE